MSKILLLISLPLLEIISANFAKKYTAIHRFILLKIILSSIVISCFLPISNDIEIVNFGVIKLKFMCDIYSYCFGILVNIIWLLTALYTHSYIKQNISRNKINHLFHYLSLSIFAVFGGAYSADLWTLFLFYVLLVLFTAPLIIQNVNKTSLKARNIYLITHFLTSFLFFLPAIILIKIFSGNVNFSSLSNNNFLENHLHFASFILFLFVIGISKNCLLPFHNWISRSTVAPNPVSALLHSVAAVKSGSIAIIKIVIYIFGIDLISKLTENFLTGGWIFYLCGITAIYAAYRAWKTTDIKKRFAYSTISQLSYIMSSVMIATKLAILGAMLHIVSHSICKAILFYVAGIFTTVYQAKSTREVARIAPHLKLLSFCIAFCGASIIGFPMLPGSFGKDYMIMSEMQTHHYASVVFLITGSLINVLYIYPIIKAAFFSKYDKNDTYWLEKRNLKIPFTMKIAVFLAMIIAISMSVAIYPIINFLKLYDV